MRNDDVLLNEAYSKIYNEGIWDRLKGQASGIGAGLKQGVQNVAGKIAGATGANVQTSGKTMGGAYANAQQTSLLNSFIKKAQGELNDFINDMSKMGAGSIQDVQKTHPQIAQQMQQVNGVIEFLKQSAAGQKPEATAQSPAGQTPQAPATQEPQSPAAEAPKEDPKSLEASTSSGTGALTVQQPKTLATPEQATGGAVQGIPHGPQRTSTPGGTTNTSFSMAKSVPNGAKQLNQLPKEEPVQPAFKSPAEQDAEIVGGEEKPQTQGYVDAMAQDDGKKPEAQQTPSAPQPDVDDTYTGPKGITYTFQPTKNGDGWVDQNGKYNSGMQRTLTLGWQKQQAANAKK
jgi:hypothetical protein